MTAGVVTAATTAVARMRRIFTWALWVRDEEWERPSRRQDHARVACGDGMAHMRTYGGNFPAGAGGRVLPSADRESEKGQLLSGAVLFL
ncbi:hypothetical protein GCM10010498_38780 [Streptomyces cavourensis]|nr:hypothetical protein GCM10010498_38780 [Streptomyces cavourensis]